MFFTEIFTFIFKTSLGKTLCFAIIPDKMGR